MRYLLLLFCFCYYNISAQLELQAGDLENLTTDEKNIIADYLNVDGRKVFLRSKYTDTLFFNQINSFRTSKNLTSLKHSIRLDTLANIVIHKNTITAELKHFHKFPDLQTSLDLFGVENLNYLIFTTFDINRVSKFINLNEFLTTWISSPGHLKNLTRTMEVGTAQILLQIVKKNDSYVVEMHGIYEADYTYSQRELDNKYKKLNNELVHNEIINNNSQTISNSQSLRR